MQRGNGRKQHQLAHGLIERHECQQPTGELRNRLCVACYWRHGGEGQAAGTTRGNPADGVGLLRQGPSVEPTRHVTLARGAPGFRWLRGAVRQLALPLEWMRFERRLTP